MARVRVHQHVNPLSPHYRQTHKPIDLASVFADPAVPLHLDIGCGRGRFIHKMSELESGWNFIGIEIREPLVDEANRLRSEANLTNLHYIFANAMFGFETLIQQIPDVLLHTVTIQFPDPWFKRKHAKRRMVNKELVDTVADKLSPGGLIFVQSDIQFLAREMFELFRRNRSLNERRINANPFQVKTEREISVENREIAVYRAIFVKDNI